MKLKDLMEKYGEYDVEEWFEIGTDGVADEKGIKLKKPKPKTVWDLERGDHHCWVDITGAVCVDFAWRDDEEDKLSREAGNVFLTKEEAEQDLERRKVENLLLKYGGRRWFKNGKENWFITFDRSVGFFRYVYTIRDQRQGPIYFDTEEQAEKAILEIGEERLKKALFEVR